MSKFSLFAWCLIAIWSLNSWGQISWGQEQRAEPPKPGDIVMQLAADVDEVAGVISNQWVIDWMEHVRELPSIEPKTVRVNEKDFVIDEGVFYYSRYGSPLAYARLLDLAVSAGFEPNPGSRIFDFGYGSIGHLRMLALAGHHSVGVDVAPLLKIMYQDSSGPLGTGSVQVFDGRFPKETELVHKIGGDYDLVISKNVLKRGYIHPSRPVTDPRMVIDLGVDDSAFLTQIASMLKPGGLFVIYNYCPPKAADDKPYIPWAEGESPFSREQFFSSGFEVVHLDVVDDMEARRIGHALGWDAPGGMKLDSELFAWYTVVRKKP